MQTPPAECQPSTRSQFSGGGAESQPTTRSQFSGGGPVRAEHLRKFDFFELGKFQPSLKSGTEILPSRFLNRPNFYPNAKTALGKFSQVELLTGTFSQMQKMHLENSPA